MTILVMPFEPKDYQTGDLYPAADATDLSHAVADLDLSSLTHEEAIEALQTTLSLLATTVMKTFAGDTPFGFNWKAMTEETYQALVTKDPDTYYVRPGAIDALLASLNLIDLTDTAEARDNLGLGTAALEDADDLDTAIATHAATAKTTPVDADEFPLIDSAASYGLKRTTLLQLATYVIAKVTASAPATLDTLNELAAALGNDPNFAATITTALGLKAPLASPTFTGTVSGITKAMVGLGSADNTADSAKSVASAATLTTARAINGVNFNGSAAITIVPRVGSTASSATPTIDMALYEQYNITALAAAITSWTISNPADGLKLLIRIKDNGTARALTFSAVFRAIGVTLPSTTVLGKTLYLGCVYNAADSKLDVVAVGQEA